MLPGKFPPQDVTLRAKANNAVGVPTLDSTIADQIADEDRRGSRGVLFDTAQDN